MSTDVKLLKKPKASLPCISLSGMAGSGKTTIGVALARALGWAFIDTDSLIEAAYATRLQDISDALSRDAFLNMEADFICSLRTSRTVISTGGSVVYRDRGMKRLRDLGLIVRLDAPFRVIEERVSRNPQRGLVIGKGQTLESLCEERSRLYAKYADIACDATRTPSQCADWIISQLPEKYTSC